MDKRLLDAGEIKAIWKQSRVQKLPDATFRFATEIALAQLRKIESLTYDDPIDVELARRNTTTFTAKGGNL